MSRLLHLLIFAFFFHITSSGEIYLNRGRGYHPFTYATTDGVLLSNRSSKPLIDTISVIVDSISGNKGSRGPFTEAELNFHINNRHAHPSHRYEYSGDDGKAHTRSNPPWGILLTDSNGTNCWITISNTEKPDPFSSTSATLVAINDSTGSRAKAEVGVKSNLLPFTGESLWKIRLENGILKIIAGEKEPSEIMTIPADIADIASFGFATSPGGEILVSDISFIPTTPSTIPDFSTLDLKSIEELISTSKDDIEGYWEIFDRTLEESLLKLGGDYKMAVVKNHDRYEIIYLEGARVNAGKWQPGMIKGYLIPTSFPGLYNLEWIDAQGKRLSYALTAQTGDGDTLLLQFPYHSSTVRLRRAIK